MIDVLLTDGRFIDVALVAIVVELAILAGLARAGRTRLRLRDVAGQMLAGGLLLAALRVALAGGDTLWVVLLMTASFPAHRLDLSRRVTAAR
ncbi:MAG: hypothetical protein JNK45_00720 [Myxococcales bacterium]|nr:hypothetical protein [Myxococcales bacterium]